MTKVIKQESEWRAQLSELAFEVTRNAATERPFLEHNFPDTQGLFHCICCNSELFSSSSKYNSGSGWPSFYQKYQTANIIESEDNSYGMKRIEVSCGTCDAHLGHLFPDGPKPTGLRYCINGSALIFKDK